MANDTPGNSDHVMVTKKDEGLGAARPMKTFAVKNKERKANWRPYVLKEFQES